MQKEYLLASKSHFNFLWALFECYLALHFFIAFQVCLEDQRFEKLMEHFKNEDNNIDFMV